MKKKRKEIIVSAVLFIVALAFLVAMSGRTEDAPAFDLLSKLAFALLVAVVIRSTLIFLYGEGGDAFDKFQDLGMEELYYPLTDKNFKELLSESEHIKVLKTWFPESPDIEAGLEEAIGKGATVKLLLLDPSSEILTQRVEGAHRPPSEGSSKIYSAIFKVHEWLTQKSDAHSNADVEIGLYNSWPGCPVIWYDKKYLFSNSKRIIMGFYFRKKSSPSWPWIRVKTGSELAGILEAQWDDLWGHESTRHLRTVEEIKAWLDENKRFGEIPEIGVSAPMVLKQSILSS